MNLLDVIILAMIGISMGTGFRAGFARVSMGLLAGMLGVVFGFWFYGTPAAWVRTYVHSTTVANLIGFILVFWAFLLAGALAGKIFSKLFKWTGLSWLDRAMGAAFGLVRGALITVALIAVLVAFTAKPVPNWMVDSKLLPYATGASGKLAALAPNAIKEAFRESLREIRILWDTQIRINREKLEALKPGAKNKSEAEKTR
ncbi:MAG: CvpA family protein [Bryobacterales bacterium]|nr:CvpA family protein [Bryobacterales bacterium]